MQTLKNTGDTERKGMLSCVDVAKYFLVLANSGDGKKITLPQLVRLVCIAQGVSLALRGRPLFSEDIEAREYELIAEDLHRNFGNPEGGAALKNTRS